MHLYYLNNCLREKEAYYMLIRQGDTGVNVINLQYGLYTLNFNPKEIDGIYGNRTTEAV